MANSHNGDGKDAGVDACSKDYKTNNQDYKGDPNRRSFLKMGAAAAGAAAVGAGAVGTVAGRSKAAVTHHGITFNTVLDAVNDLGMDPTGEDAVDGAIQDAMADDTLIEFPPGTYLWTKEHDYLDYTNTGIRSTTGDPSDVTFTFPQGSGLTFLAIKDTSTNVLLEGFEVDMKQDQETGGGIVVRVDDNMQVHNIDFTGFCPKNYPSSCLYAAVEATAGVGVIDGVTIDGGGVIGVYPERMNGIFSGIPHIGEMIVRNCDVRELGSTGIRFTGGEGAVKVEDCYFENVDNAALRLNGNDHAGGKQSWAKRCKFVNDDSLVEHLPSDENYQNADMIRVDDSNHYFKGLLIEDCTFIHRSDPDEAFIRGCIARPGYAEHGSFTVRGCTMQIDDDGPEAIDAVSSSDRLENTVTIEDTHITGTLNSTASGSIIHIGGSDESVVKNCCISTPDAEDGILVENSSNCTVESSDIDVPGRATKFVNSSVSTSNITSDGACRLPGDGSSDDGSSDDGSSDDGSSDDTSTDYHSLRITGTGPPTNYKFTVSGELQSGDADDLESWDVITDSTAEGWVTEETHSDTFEFTGEVTDFEFLAGDATVELDGDEIDPNSNSQTLDREVKIVSDAETYTDYTFSVDGDIEPVTDGDMPAGDSDNVTADGDLMVVDGLTSDTSGDRWKFSGEVVDLTLEAEGAVYIDGSQVDPAKVGTSDTETFPHHIVFDGAASTDVCEYEFGVSGAVAKSPDLGSMEAADELTEGVVTGSVTEDTDGFRFSGSLTKLNLDGTADVTFE